MARQPDRVRVEQLEVAAPIGVYAHEHGILQTLVIDLTLETDLTQAATTDDLQHAIDYDRLAAIAREIATSQHHALIETVAEKIAAKILAQFAAATAVCVRVAKPGAVKDARTVAIELWRYPS
jgi:dihydroneopterin aldolase